MASQKVTGWTNEQLMEEQAHFEGRHGYDFTDWFCLKQIPRQPDDYDGPDRYCKNPTSPKDDEEGRHPGCHWHKGVAGTEAAETAADHLEDDQFEEGNTAATTHGMYTEDENLKDDFSEADEELFDLIMGWAEDYGFGEGSPAYMELESLALSKVREMRAEKYLNENGELVEREQYNPEAERVETWEEVHPLSDHLRLKKKTILSIMKELGLTPKSEAQMGEAEANASASEAIGEVAAEALDSDENEYDPGEFSDDA